MPHFDKDFLKFFRELEKNNSKDWFDENRKRYETVVRDPWKAYIKTLAVDLQKLYPGKDLEGNVQVSRINRDIRFSRDKTPYKDHVGAMIMPNGRADKGRPGFYIQANQHDVRVYSGAYKIEKERLSDIRYHIAENMGRFKKIIGAKEFVDTFGEIRGEKNKRLPKELQDSADKQPLIYNKSFYWFFKLDPMTIMSDSLTKELVTTFKKSMPLNKFFEEAIG